MLYAKVLSLLYAISLVYTIYTIYCYTGRRHAELPSGQAAAEQAHLQGHHCARWQGGHALQRHQFRRRRGAQGRRRLHGLSVEILIA